MSEWQTPEWVLYGLSDTVMDWVKARCVMRIGGVWEVDLQVDEDFAGSGLWHVKFFNLG
jgi:hypothetical protein